MTKDIFSALWPEVKATPGDGHLKNVANSFIFDKEAKYVAQFGHINATSLQTSTKDPATNISTFDDGQTFVWTSK